MVPAISDPLMLVSEEVLEADIDRSGVSPGIFNVSNTAGGYYFLGLLKSVYVWVPFRFGFLERVDQYLPKPRSHTEYEV